MRPTLLLAMALPLTLALAACKDDAVVPEPLVMTDEALGFYCQMYLTDHAGPKGQVFLDGYAQPVWFSQVADVAAYRGDPERPASIAAIYVSDMGAAESWAVPGPANWIDAAAAHYVVGSNQAGGMGLPEAIPFGTEAAAAAFAAEHGGKVVGWDEVPDDIGRGAMPDGPMSAPAETGMAGHHMPTPTIEAQGEKGE